MTKTINILEAYYEPGMSGITRHVGMIIEELQHDSSFSFHVLCSTNDNKIPEYYRTLGIPVVRVPGAKYFSVSGMFEILKLVRKWKIDIVHIHNLQSVFWGHLPKIFLPHTRFFFTPHIINFENKTLEKAFYIIWRYFAILSNRIVAISDIQKEILAQRKILKPEHISLIPNSVRFSQESSQTQDHPVKSSEIQRPCVLSLIRLARQKNPHQIVSIAKEICSRFPDVRFYIAGEGDLLPEIKAQIRTNGLESQVILLGQQKHGPRLIGEADIILSTSLWEGIPYTILEALFFGKPVAASNIEGHKALVKHGETGYLATTTEEFVEKIGLLLKDETLRQGMGQKGRRLFDDNFSFQDFILRTKNLYLKK